MRCRLGGLECIQQRLPRQVDCVAKEPNVDGDDPDGAGRGAELDDELGIGAGDAERGTSALNTFTRLFDCRSKSRVLCVAQTPEVVRQVSSTDNDCIDAVQGGDLVRAPTASFRFDLDHTERCTRLDASVLTSSSWPKSAVAIGWEPEPPDERGCLSRRFDSRRDDAIDAGIEDRG